MLIFQVKRSKKKQELAITSKQNLGKILQWLIEKLKVHSKFPKFHLQDHQ